MPKPSPSWDNTANATPNSRARVLLIIKGLGVGGAERLVADVVAAGDRSRFDYEVAYVLRAQDALAPELEATGVTIHALGADASWDLRWLSALRRVLRDGNFDIVHSHLPYTAAFGRLVSRSLPRQRRPRLVYTEHSLWNRAAILTKALNSLTVCMDDALFVVSPAARDALPPRLRGRARVVVHGVDRARAKSFSDDRMSSRREVRREIGAAPDDVIVLTVANMREEKGYDVLLEAASSVLRSSTDVRFVSVGSGPGHSSLTAQRESLGIADRFAFLGHRADAMRIMAAADIFVLPSRQEGMPVALMEAMSVGLPVVATVVGGVPDVVTTGQQGLLVPPGRPDLLAEAVSRLARDPALRACMSRFAIARSADFDVRRAARQIEDLYDELLGRGER